MTENLSLAWHGAAFQRSKRMPDLAQIIRQATRGDPYARTREEAAEMEHSMRMALRDLGAVAVAQQQKKPH